MASQLDCDVLIIGGGLTGLTAGLALSAVQIPTVLIDAAVPQSAPTFDGRVTALTQASVNVFSALRIWHELERDAERINDILVTDGRTPGRFENGGAAPFFLHFDGDDGDKQRPTADAPLGFIVENRLLLEKLWKQAERADFLRLYAPATVDAMDSDRTTVSAQLSNGDVVRTRLCLACDGRNSPTRARLGLKTLSWSYPQSGLVTTVGHEEPHHGIAQEYFLPAGPFAILPMTNNRSSLVWSERKDLAQQIVALDAPDFEAELHNRFGDYLGALKPMGPRFSYPLSFLLAHTYVADRCALVGDAAHVIHPIAGQGFNIGLKDVAALVQVVRNAKALGLDIGSADVLDQYQRWRRFDNASLAFVTDGLNRLFSSNRMPQRVLRDLGMAAVDKIGPLRRFFSHQASGTSGALPALLKGELP